MKTIFKIFVLPVCFSCLFLSCNNNILPDVKSTFENMYPNAKRVDWDVEHGYYVAEFRHEGYEKEAWFNSSGAWLLTETDLERNLPNVIATALNNTEYASWRLDDADYIEQKDKEPFYVVEVEKGELEKDLYFSEVGELLDAQQGSGDYRWVPY